MSSEIDRQTPPQEPELAQKREKDAETAQQASAKAAEQVRLGPLDSEETPKGEAGAPPVEIPETRAVQLARAALQTAPQGSTAEQMDALVRRKAAVTTAVRKALVQEEITRRAQWQEDDAQTRMTGQPPAPAHIQEELQRRADKVKAGELPFVHVPHNVNFKPKGVDDLTRTIAEGKGAFSGTYYHAPEVSPADIYLALKKTKDAQRALDALVATWKGNEMPVELASHSRSNLRQRAPQLVTVLVFVAGIAAWLYHSHEAKRRAAEAVEAAAATREQQARSIVARVRNSWNADDNWEDTFSSKGAAFTPYTIELDNALITGRPIVAFGLVGDVRKSGEQDNSIVLIQDIGRTMKWDLHFSLLSAPGITKAILNDEDRQSDTFVIAATITSVEKVSMFPDKSDNDLDYFLAHGILHEAQPIGLWDQPPHK
jgi:hypothetical protein